MSDTPLWSPTREQIAHSNLARFRAFLGARSGESFSSFRVLRPWTVEHPEEFWTAVWDFCEVTASERWDRVLTPGERMQDARWFEGARLNFAENLLRYRDDRPALIFRGEDGRRQVLTYAKLFEMVARLAGSLAAAGVGPGDRVAGFMPNIPETVVAMLATSSLGGVWSSCSPDFGVNGVIDRFGQIGPRILFAADGYLYNGKTIDSLARIGDIADSLDTVEKVIVVPFVGAKDAVASRVEALPRAVLWDRFLSEGANLQFAQLPFNHPLYIMYSSGTTGVPKCIVHGAGGTLLQHLKEHQLHTDLGRDDVLFYFTTCGWMMWNWLVSGLATGATLVLYDGSPMHPTPGTLWKMAEDEGITVFGTSAKYLAALEKAGETPRDDYDLKSLRTILSTGSPLAPESFDYVYRDIKKDLQLSSISGGTDIISCFALGCPSLPVYRGELQCRGLGMAVQIRDEDGHPVRGEKGELVCTRPFPSMPIGFWDDPDGAKYRAAYFERWPDVWCHGDYAELTEHGGLIIHGRSDAVLNPGGVRIGTAEIYRQVEKLTDIVESVAIGQQWQGDVRVVLFVILREALELTDALARQIRESIRMNTTPRHVPAKIVQVTDIPRTISGKIAELAVRNVVHGEPVTNTDALANPEALDEYRDRPELATD